MKTVPHFLGLALLYSLPLWVAASFLDTTKFIPVKLPLSALTFLSILLAAMVVTRQNDGSWWKLLVRGLDVQQIQSPGWKVGIFVLMPLALAASYLFMRWSGFDLPDKRTPLYALPLFLLIYGVSGYCEQIGWTAVMTDELLQHKSVVTAGLIVGVTWAVWHIIPFMQTHNTAVWIFWQCLFTIIYRVLLTKVYVVTGHTVFSTIALHATYNTAFSLMPYYGSSYNPMYMTLVTLSITIFVLVAF